MDWPAIIAKIAGLALLALTIRSIVKHFRIRKVKRLEVQQRSGIQQARSEEFLNNVILYLWHAFMLVFSIGLMVNN